MINPNDYVVVDGIPVPEGLDDLVLTQDDLVRITDEVIFSYMRDVQVPLVVKHHPDAKHNLQFITGHVHVKDEGVEPHDHLPYAFTSVLYLSDAQGALVIDPHGDAIEILPKTGRMVIMKASLVHSAKKSPQREMRLALVTNFSYPGIRMPLTGSVK